MLVCLCVFWGCVCVSVFVCSCLVAVYKLLKNYKISQKTIDTICIIGSSLWIVVYKSH